MTPDFKPGVFTRALLKQQTERDKQVKIGASNLSDPCGRCLAEDMLGVPQPESKYWLGGVIGTAIHALLEERNADPDCLTEQRVVLGEIPGYGEVKSTTDLFHVPSGTSVDFKSTTRDKLVFIKRALVDEPHELEPTKVAQARATTGKYLNQLMLYGLGLENAGHTVRRVSMVFICRDGKTDEDVWSHTQDYDRQRALTVFERGAKLWAWLQEGHMPEELSSAPHCYRCGLRREN